MKKLYVLLLLICIGVSVSHGAMAENFGGNLTERKPGKVECNPELKRCLYPVQNSSAPKIIDILKNSILEGTELVASSEGHLIAVNKNLISFWSSDPEKLKAMIDTIPGLDIYDVSPPPAMIELSLAIYQVTENGMSNIQASIQNLQSTHPESVAQIFSGDTGALTMNMGAVALAGIIQAGRSSGDVKYAQELHKTIQNNTKFSMSKTMPVYISPNTVQSYTDKAGITFNGEVALQRDEGKYLLLKNYGITFGVKLGDTDVDTLSISDDALNLWDGNSSIIVADVQNSTQHNRGGGLFNLFKNSQRSYSKLMMVITAHALSATEYQQQNERLSNISPRALVLSKSEIETLPQTGDVNQALESLITDATVTPLGTPILSFKIDKEKLSRQSYDQTVKISVRGQGLKVDDYRDLQNLALAPFKFSEKLSMNELRKPMLKFRVTFEACKECGAREFPARSFDLIYIPNLQRLSIVK